MKRLLLAATLIGCGGGGGGGGGGDDEPGVDAPTPTKYGSVFIQSFTAEQPPGTIVRGGAASADFSTIDTGCPETELGACILLDCTQAAPAPVSAGTITITGATLPISLVPGTDKKYAGLSSQTQTYYTDGAMVSFAASGADVPAFTVGLTTPSKATITAPVEPPSASPYLMVSRASPFSVSWTGGGSGQIQVALFAGSPSTKWIVCRFPASAGSGSVPTSTIAMLPAGQGSFAMSAIAATEIVAGDYGIHAMAYSNAVWTDGSIVSGPTMFQ